MKLPVLAAGGVVSVLVAVTGCGGSDDVPPNAVAKVGDTTISTSEFDKRLHVGAEGESQGSTPISYEPPDFDRCVAAKDRQNAAPEGKKGKSEDTLRDECRDDYARLRTQAMEFLIQQAWVREAAGKADVKVTDADVRKEFDRQKDQAFPTKKAYQQFLRSSGRTEADILAEMSTTLSQQRLARKMTAGKVKVSGPEIEGYYVKHKKELGKPERRSLRVLIAKTKARAEEAKQALASGEGWDTVAKTYSIDKATAAKGGRVPEVAGTGDPKIDKALKTAQIGDVSDPIENQYGWWVFEVEKVFPATLPSLKEARAQIFTVLKDQQEQKALDEFAASFRAEYRAKTVCADDYKVASCKNGPEKNPTTPEKTMQGPQSN